MKNIINKYFALLLGTLGISGTFSSCTDQEDIDISYDQNIGITAAHIFDNYEPFMDGDFDMSKDGWKLNLKVLIYDEEGKLIEKTEKLCDNLSETFNYVPSLAPGDYTVLSIADFREGLGGKGYKFWDISNESNLQDISITENQNIYPVVFETLGIDVKKLSVKDCPQTINADIKPTTSLVQVFMSDKDYSSWGIDGYSRFSILSEGYFIKAIKFKNNVRFENGALAYKYSEQVSDYNIAISKVYEKWSEKEAPTGYNYRALLPEENKGFSFHIQKRDLPQDYYDSFVTLCGEFDVDGFSNVLPEMASNKQYVVNMIFDAMQLVAMELPADYTHEAYTQQFVKDYNNGLLEHMVNMKYENILGKNEDYANTFLDMKPYNHGTVSTLFTSHYPRSRAGHFEQFVTCSYLNSDYTNCAHIQLLLPTLSDEQMAYMKQLLSSRFNPEEEGIYGPTTFTYLEPNKPADDSRYRVVFEKRYNEDYKMYTYFLNFILRSKYY